MKQKFLIKENRPNLVLFFAGWGMDEHPFRPLIDQCPEDSDWLICYDYNTLDFDCFLVEGYQKITVYAWSFGVWVAQTIMTKYDLPIVSRIAINGTPEPLDPLYGIPIKKVIMTVLTIRIESLQKFHKRMCSSKDSYMAFAEIAPQRDMQEVRRELSTFISYCTNAPIYSKMTEYPCWDGAVIGKKDRIFLPENQHRYWKDHSKQVIIKDIAHYDVQLPFFGEHLLTNDQDHADQ